MGSNQMGTVNVPTLNGIFFFTKNHFSGSTAWEGASSWDNPLVKPKIWAFLIYILLWNIRKLITS